MKYFLSRIFNQNRDIQNIDVDKDREFLNKFSEPHSDTQRSLYQYYCQRSWQSRKIKIFTDLIASLLYLPLLIVLMTFSLQRIKIVYKNSIFWNKLGSDIVPETIQRKYTPTFINEKEIGFLKKEDILYIFNILKEVGFHPMFLMKVTLRISFYRKLIEKYKPNYIIATAEYSYTSSILTYYCEKNEIKHINIMHGEKLYDITDSFFRFTNFYVWDKHYINLFIKLRAEKSQFIIELPKLMTLKSFSSPKNRIDYKIYLDSIDEEQIKTLKIIIDRINKKKFSIIIRPHPVYTNLKLLKKYVSNIYIEDFSEISIEESLFTTNNVIAKYSTVLNQAYHLNVNVVIDDISNKKIYQALKDLDYIMLRYPHELLSKIIGQV